MNYRLLAFFSFWLVVLTISCNQDEISFDSPSQALRFSRDTVFCDTVYNQVRSETYALKVYNDENKDIMIPRISLQNGAASLYRINVDGKPGTEFTNIPLRKKDSLFIFVEIAPVANATEAIAEDRILFTSGIGDQQVTLFSVVQDAEFFIQTETNQNILSENTNWSNEKAKIIFGDLTLQEGKTLNINAGTKVYFFKNSGLKIGKNAQLNVNGNLGSEVTFRGDRNDPRYDTIPKNWKGIDFEQGAKLNMNYARVFGGTKGLNFYENTAQIKNTIIHTFEEFGIYAVNSTVNASNLVINNCGDAAFGIFKGGNIQLNHCTLANFWSFNSVMTAYSLYATNEWINADGNTENAGLSLNITNSILYNGEDNAMVFNPINGQTFEYSIRNSLLKYGSDAGFAFEGNNRITNSIKNEDPLFLNYYTQKMNLRVKDLSPAKSKGLFLPDFPTDIAGITRSNPPTIGAYQ